MVSCFYGVKMGYRKNLQEIHEGEPFPVEPVRPLAEPVPQPRDGQEGMPGASVKREEALYATAVAWLAGQHGHIVNLRACPPVVLAAGRSPGDAREYLAQKDGTGSEVLGVPGRALVGEAHLARLVKGVYLTQDVACKPAALPQPMRAYPHAATAPAPYAYVEAPAPRRILLGDGLALCPRKGRGEPGE